MRQRANLNLPQLLQLVNTTFRERMFRFHPRITVASIVAIAALSPKTMERSTFLVHAMKPGVNACGGAKSWACNVGTSSRASFAASRGSNFNQLPPVAFLSHKSSLTSNREYSRGGKDTITHAFNCKAITTPIKSGNLLW